MTWTPLSIIVVVLTCEAGLAVVGFSLISEWFRKKRENTMFNVTTFGKIASSLGEKLEGKIQELKEEKNNVKS